MPHETSDKEKLMEMFDRAGVSYECSLDQIRIRGKAIRSQAKKRSHQRWKMTPETVFHFYNNFDLASVTTFS